MVILSTLPASDPLVQLRTDFLLQTLAQLRITQGIALVVANKEDILDTLTKGGNFGVLQLNVKLQKNPSNARQ